MNKLNRSIILSCLFAFNASATTLAEALANAYQHNPELIAAREEQKKTDEVLYKAISGFLPKLDYEIKQNNAKVDTHFIRRNEALSNR